VQKPTTEPKKDNHIVYSGNDKSIAAKWKQAHQEALEAKRKGIILLLLYPLSVPLPSVYLHPSLSLFIASVLINGYQRNSSSAKRKRRSGKPRN
jgi:hypothetical protein